MAKAKVCRYCTSYRPYEKLRGCIGMCEKKNKAKGLDQTCEAFSEGPQVWMCGVPVKESKDATNHQTSRV